jgi:hypothetical protein
VRTQEGQQDQDSNGNRHTNPQQDTFGAAGLMDERAGPVWHKVAKMCKCDGKRSKPVPRYAPFLKISQTLLSMSTQNPIRSADPKSLPSIHGFRFPAVKMSHFELALLASSAVMV